MSEANIIEKSFRPWKMWLAITMGLLVVGFLFYRSVSSPQFIYVGIDKGEYSWVDTNSNARVDRDDPSEFELNPKGEYRKESAWERIGTISWTKESYLWLLLALVFMFGRDYFYVLRIRYLTKKELSWKAGFYVIMMWEFASALSPGVVGGAAVAMFILNREKIALGRSTAIVFATAFMDNLFFVSLIPFVFFFVDQHQLFPAHLDTSQSMQYIFWLGFSVILLVCLFLFTALFIFPNSASWFIKKLFRFPLLRRWYDKIERVAEDLQLAAKELRKEGWGFWIKVYMATFLSWTSRYLVINALLQAFIGLGFTDHILILGKQLILWLFMLVTPTPGGSGVAEFAFSELLAGFGGSIALIAGIALLWRLISYFPYLFIGAYLLPKWLRRTSTHTRDTTLDKMK